jgi:tetratricopeptide (TPR) repeat protein
MAAALRVSQRWTQLQPNSASAWHTLASSQLYLEKFDEALQSRGRAASLRVGNVGDLLFPGIVALHRGTYEDADRVFRLHLRTGTREMQLDARHWLSISLRSQGRIAEALAVAEQLLDEVKSDGLEDAWSSPGKVMKALALFDSRRHREAAQLFASLARDYDQYSPSRQARSDAWVLTHAGTALAAAGDTGALASLADSVETIGARSGYARDQRLHHYLRALLGRARGAREAEVEAHLRAALYSVPHGFSRINLELGRSLLRQGRYHEAASVARAALANSSESNGLYATRTEFHELLGNIWEVAGDAELAAVHYRAALNAWRSADPQYRDRMARMEGVVSPTSAGEVGGL